MSLSPETLARLRAAQENEAHYQPNSTIRQQLESRALIMIVAPTAMGKTFIMNRVSGLDNRFGRSSVLSTRDPRPDDDPGMFRLFKNDDHDVNQILDRVDRGELVQYMIHPTENTIYGTELQDHPHGNNLLATLSSSIDHLRGVGFGKTTVIGLVTWPKVWLTWFNQRYPGPSPKRLSRLIEAKQSYDDLLARNDIHWIINIPDDADQTARTIIDAADGRYENDPDAIPLVHQTMELINVMLIKAKGETTHESTR